MSADVFAPDFCTERALISQGSVRGADFLNSAAGPPHGGDTDKSVIKNKAGAGSRLTPAQHIKRTAHWQGAMIWIRLAGAIALFRKLTARLAHSGDLERSIRSIMNTDSGDHEHPLALA
jgi:hypothetical protein